MWIPKWRRDEKRKVDSPVPTQVVSNEEYIPRPQNSKQAQVESLIQEMSERNAKRLNMHRRDFMRSSMGLATAFLASNMVYGSRYWDVDEVEALEPQASEEKFPKGEYFVMDVQAHFTNGLPLRFRSMEFVRNMGFQLENDADAYGFPNFLKEMYLDSETSVLVISGVPGKEFHRAKDLPAQFQDPDMNPEQVLVDAERTPGPAGQVLPSWVMARRRDEINRLAGSVRAFAQGNCAPNHYWDRASNQPDYGKLFEQMEREVEEYGINSWKWYCHTDPGRSGNGFKLDDEGMTYRFYEKSKQLGLKIFSVHKGYASQSATLGHLAHPADIEKAALDNPDLTFIIYHSAIKHGPNEGEAFKAMYDPETGDFEWHAALIDIKKRNPEMANVYPEIGSAFGTTAIAHPEMCQHLMGRNVKHYGSDHVIWGTDCLWWGSPQWVIEAFKRFQITDEMAEKWGYAKLTKEDKANIFGLNAAKIYGFDPDQRMSPLPADALDRVKEAYLEQGGPLKWASNAAHGWVRDDTG